MVPMTEGPILVLGAGYTGRVVLRRLASSSRACVATFRNRLPRAGAGTEYLHVDLGKPETWRSIPPATGCVWTFPAEPAAQVEAFADVLFREPLRVVVIGTTSSYVPPREDEPVTEDTPLDPHVPRVPGEEHLRQRGAVIVRAAGIYGPARNPLDWLRRGIASGAEGVVNLIHVEDLASALIAALERAPAGEQYCASDGTPRRWKEIALWARERGFVREPRFGAGGRSNAISNKKLLALLRRPLDHPDLYRELEILEQERGGKGLS